MNAFSKKIMSAFVNIDEVKNSETPPLQRVQYSTPAEPAHPQDAELNNRFVVHFDKLFADARLPSPGYYEFSRMVAAMHTIPDEQSRYCAAFAGLQVQGVDKQKLLTSTQQYLQVLEEDSITFHQSLSTAFDEKVSSKKEAMTKLKEEMQTLSQRILQLQEQATQLTVEIAENEIKIQSSNSGYNTAMEACKKNLSVYIKKINEYLS